MPRCHIAVVGSCEGETVIWANWAVAHRSQLEALLGVAVDSVSWLAADIAPVGHLVSGALQAKEVTAGTWVLVTSYARRMYYGVTNALADTLVAAGVRTWHLAIDVPQNNLRKATEPSSETRHIAVPAAGFPAHVGGLFRATMLEELFGAEAERRRS